jgi:hypothetical protein
MLASSPASILNQTAPDLSIPLRFNSSESGSNGYAARPGVIFCTGFGGTLESSMLSPSAIVG